MIRAAYIHIPFCEQICHYCDFNKVYLKGQPVDEYLDSLGKEMQLTLELYPAGMLDSIFVGGGTPTALNEKQLVKLCETIRACLPYNKNTEYTFEANPGDLARKSCRFWLRTVSTGLALAFKVLTMNCWEILEEPIVAMMFLRLWNQQKQQGLKI